MICSNFCLFVLHITVTHLAHQTAEAGQTPRLKWVVYCGASSINGSSFFALHRNMETWLEKLDLICYSWYKYCLGSEPDLMSLTDWCFVMDQHTHGLRSRNELRLRWAPLRWLDQDHEHPENSPAASAATSSDPLNQKWGHLDHQGDPMTWPSSFQSWIVISG